MDMNLVMPAQTLVYLCITCIILAIMPIAAVIYWKKKCKKRVNIAPLFIGAVGFIICVRVLELLVHMFCIIQVNPVSLFINGHTWAYVLYGTAMAGIFEEVGRYIIMRYLWKKNKSRENVIMYGIGHGGIEVWAITLMQIGMFLAIAVMISTQGMGATMQSMGVTEETQASFMAMIPSITGFGAESMVMTVFERIAAMLLHISMSVVVYYGICKQEKKFVVLAVLMHAIFDVFAALYQRAVVSLIVCEIWIAIWAVVSVIWAYRLYQKLAAESKVSN